MKTKSITVTVTEENLRDGKRASPRDCPIALALGGALALPQGQYVNVGAYAAHILDEEGDLFSPQAIRLPDDVIAKLRLIDLGRTVEPFSFEITPPRLTP